MKFTLYDNFIPKSEFVPIGLPFYELKSFKKRLKICRLSMSAPVLPNYMLRVTSIGNLTVTCFTSYRNFIIEFK